MTRRMFSDEITSTDAFLDMPSSSQLLYFQLGMSADDDGFIANPKMIMRVVGASTDDLKLLIAKKFILQFESGVCVVKHWRINNQIRKDIYKETKYISEKQGLFIKENGAYSFNSENAVLVPKGHFTISNLDYVDESSTLRQPSIDKLSIDKLSIDKQMSDFEKFWKIYPKKTSRKLCESLWKKNKLDLLVDEIILFVEKAKTTDRWKKGFIKNPETFIRQESWRDDLSAYGGASTVDTYKNKSENSTAQKLKAKLNKK